MNDFHRIITQGAGRLPYDIRAIFVALDADDQRADWGERVTDCGYSLDAPEVMPAGAMRNADWAEAETKCSVSVVWRK